MASLGHLSNAELRQKLGEYGYPVGPVTETTREVLLKKLKQLMVQLRVNDSSASTVTRRSSLNSSDESGDDDLFCRLPPGSSMLGKPERKAPKKSYPKTPGRRPRPSTVHPSASQHAVNSSRGSVGVTRQDYASCNRPNWRSTLNYYSSYLWNSVSQRFSRRSAPYRNYSEFSDSDDFGMDDWRERNRSWQRIPASSSFLSRLSSIRFRQNNRNVDGQSGGGDDTEYDNLMPCHFTPVTTPERWFSTRSIGAPFQSDFVRRLAGLSRYTPPASQGTPPPSIYDVKENDETGGSSRPSTSRGSPSTRRWWRRTPKPCQLYVFKTAEEEGKFGCNSQIVSKILLLIAILFFVFIAVVYLSVRSRDNDIYDINEKTNNYTVCRMDEESNKDEICIQEQDLVPAIRLIKMIHPVLIQRAVNHHCSNSQSPIMSHYEAIDYLMKKTKPKSGFKLEHYYRSLKSLLIINPRWGITVLDTSTGKTGEDRSHYGPLIANGALVITDPDLPLICYLKLKLIEFLTLISLLVIGAIFLYIMRWILWWYVKYRERDSLDLFNLVEKIVDVLIKYQQNLRFGDPTFVSVNHVRDQLIRPSERKRMRRLWEKAVNYVDQYESRVRSEILSIDGESCKVWRWIPVSVTRNTSSSSVQLDPTLPRRNNKLWQGQAFDTMSGSPNSLLCSPTPCLKIRHMFDPDMEFTDDWPVRIEDAVLDKCGEQGVTALHIYVDRTNKEGCVYLKCASQEDAGKAYQALHGWWFDSHLVTVKYLRLERYHERFPEAQAATARLQPSNNQRLSLQWQGNSESN